MAINSIRWESTFAQSCINIAPVTCFLSHGHRANQFTACFCAKWPFLILLIYKSFSYEMGLIYKNYVVCWERYFILSFYVDKLCIRERFCLINCNTQEAWYLADLSYHLVMMNCIHYYYMCRVSAEPIFRIRLKPTLLQRQATIMKFWIDRY